MNTAHSNTGYPYLLPLAIVTVIEVKTLFERLIFVYLITFTMKTAMYEEKSKKRLNQRKLVRLIKNTISQSLFLRSGGSLITTMSLTSCPFLWFPCILLQLACGSSDNNSTCAGFTVCQKCLYRSCLRRSSMVDTTKQRNRETRRLWVLLKLQVICYILDLNELRWRNCPDKFHYQSHYSLRSFALVLFEVTSMPLFLKYRPLLN